MEHSIVRAGLVAIPLALAACASLEPIPNELDSAAYSCMQRYDPQGDPLRRVDGEPAPESSFVTINRGADALEWRQALADKAQQTLDIQYFLWRTDDTGALLLRHVLEAADRGVRVRLLMDDFDSVAWNERATVLNTHPDIEIRVFNPFTTKRGGWVQRSTELLTDLDRLNHRMHNKLFMADRRIAIVGGRNVGDEYFGAGSHHSFRDYDLITIGPVVAELTDSFETFWNSAWSEALEELPAKQTKHGMRDLRDKLAAQIAGSELLAADYKIEPRDWDAQIAEAQGRLVTGRARAVFDCPPSDDDLQFPVQVAYTLGEVAKRSTEEALIVSPYVVPLDKVRERFAAGIDDGMSVTIYTNSLAATDNTTAFAGYAKYRVDLLRAGVALRELMPDAAIAQVQQVPSSPAEFQALHGKLSVFDRRWVFVGSFNLDPRSAQWNTELGLLVDSAELAARVYEDFSVDLSDASSWRVELRDEGSGGKNRLVWMAGDRETTKQPSRGKGQTMSAWFYSLFPLDEQL
jgi:putative cardiolipin synthase